MMKRLNLAKQNMMKPGEGDLGFRGFRGFRDYRV